MSSFCFSCRMSVSPPAGGIPSPNSALLASVEMTDDPVTKAVMENVLGRLPTKKPRVSWPFMLLFMKVGNRYRYIYCLWITP